MTLNFTIPIKTVSESNQREHYMAKARRKKAHTEAGLLLTREALAKHGPLLRITLTRVAPRTLDQDNLVASFKGIQDGVAEALRIDDGSPAIEWIYQQATDGKPKSYHIHVRAEEGRGGRR